jgi:hypothetical protein
MDNNSELTPVIVLRIFLEKGILLIFQLLFRFIYMYTLHILFYNLYIEFIDLFYVSKYVWSLAESIDLFCFPNKIGV